MSKEEESFVGGLLLEKAISFSRGNILAYLSAPEVERVKWLEMAVQNRWPTDSIRPPGEGRLILKLVSLMNRAFYFLGIVVQEYFKLKREIANDRKRYDALLGPAKDISSQQSAGLDEGDTLR